MGHHSAAFEVRSDAVEPNLDTRNHLLTKLHKD
jgi:hypothetical protein